MSATKNVTVAADTTSAPAPKPDGLRDGIEAIVIAFVLAFMFRAFEAEAFVIPTGSMAPNLMGVHHDVNCEVCGYRYEVNSHERDDRMALDYANDMAALNIERNKAVSQNNKDRVAQIEGAIAAKNQEYADNRTVEGTCPICRHTMNFDHVKNQPSAQTAFSGDRLIVTKFPYEFGDPRRFDVAVFKWPDGPHENYIKRIVGLPNEKISLFHGDVFTSPSEGDDPPVIVRKPVEKLLPMAQIVHDNDYVVGTNGQPDPMLAAGWPTRWSGGGWQEDAGILRFARGDSAWKPTDEGRSFALDALASDTSAWLRYQHIVPDTNGWSSVDKTKKLSEKELASARPQLISDFYAYNTAQSVNDLNGSFRGPIERAIGLGAHWVGDLMLECEIDVRQTDLEKGSLTLELVEGSVVDKQGARVPCRFQCHIELSTGEATLQLVGLEDADWSKTTRSAATPIHGAGKYELRFSNFDDQLRLWVDGTEIKFPASTAYAYPTPVFDDRNNMPTEADLAPVGIQVEHANVTVEHLRIKRDIYYIATRMNTDGLLNDYENGNILRDTPNERTQREFMANPGLWGAFGKLKDADFLTGPDEFLALGDNSPQSSDGRLWAHNEFVPRRLLVGEALFIYWPHSWFFPVPNVKDMGFVK